MDKYQSRLLVSKLSELWFLISNRLNPIQISFRNQLNYLFSSIQKEVIKGGISDKSKYVDKVISYYSKILTDIANITITRVSGEIGFTNSNNIDGTKVELVNTMSQEYVKNYVSKFSKFIINDIFNMVDMVNSKFPFDTDKRVDGINYYFNKVCKGGKSAVVSLSEVYRMHNFMYLFLMKMNGYKQKMYFSSRDNNYDIMETIMGNDDIYEYNGKKYPFPPLYTGDKSILLCKKNVY